MKSNFGVAMGMERATIDVMMNGIGETLPMGRVGEGDDIANAILFLASNESSFITGSDLLSDGGHLAANVSF